MQSFTKHLMEILWEYAHFWKQPEEREKGLYVAM